MIIELPIANTNTIIKKRRIFATPIVASIFHKNSHPCKSILQVIIYTTTGELVKVMMIRRRMIKVASRLQLLLIWKTKIFEQNYLYPIKLVFTDKIYGYFIAEVVLSTEVASK
jgi:hypothetical protein